MVIVKVLKENVYIGGPFMKQINWG